MQKTIETSENLFSIGELSEKTGMNSITLRAWERRYGLLKPQRTDKGHRLYSEQDVQLVQQILLLIERGVPLRKIKPLLEGKQELIEQEQNDDSLEIKAQIIEKLETLNQAGLAQLIAQTFKQYPVAWCRSQVIEPLFSQLLDHPNKAALEALLQAEILRYVARYQPAKKFKKADCLLVLTGEKTTAWRPALLALELSDNQACLWLPGEFCLLALRQWLSINSSQTVIYCLDGVLNESEHWQLTQIVAENPALKLEGTAAQLAFAGHPQLFSN